jgi:CRISPR-associated Csx10 family RAMP protein
MVWSRMTVVVEATTALSFRATRDPQKGAGVDFLPGPSLFGALAGAHRLIRPSGLEEFNALFARDGIRVSNGYPLGLRRVEGEPIHADAPGEGDGAPASGDSASGIAMLARPVPATAVTCKRAPGFEQPQPAGGKGNSVDEHHGVRDRLMALGAFALSERLKVGPLDELAVCRALRGGSECGQPTDSHRGFAVRDATGGWRGTRAHMGSLVRVGISDLTGTSEPEVLYSLPTLQEGSRFGIEFTGEAERLRFLGEFLEEACGGGTLGRTVKRVRALRVGTNRTRGCGALGLTARGEVEAAGENRGGFRERLEKFDGRFRDLCRRYGIDAPAAFYFSVTLLSDAIVPDGALRYVLRLDPAYLGLGGTGPGLSLVCHSARARRVHGWSAFWRMPKPDEMAIGMGSAFLYACPGSLSDEMLDGLAALEAGGLGARRQQGFGGVAVSDPFHWELGGAS